MLGIKPILKPQYKPQTGFKLNLYFSGDQFVFWYEHVSLTVFQWEVSPLMKCSRRSRQDFLDSSAFCSSDVSTTVLVSDLLAWKAEARHHLQDHMAPGVPPKRGK